LIRHPAVSQPDFYHTLHVYFEQAALRYAAIEPAFSPLAANLVRYARLQAGERVIDLGTGSGLVARLAGGAGRHVCGLDFSRAMLLAAQARGSGCLIQGDMHRLPFRASSFDVALAALALNSTDPQLSLREAWRILRPGGRLVLAEWGTSDGLSELVYETLDAYAVEDPPPALAALRAAQRQPHPWDQIETAADLRAALAAAGFDPVRIRTVVVRVTFDDAETFIRYKLAWPTRHAELEAMPPDVRALCLSDLRENVGARAGPDGRLLWQPFIVRARAVRPQTF
jgi:ubiquinone/menaquinone biosynthesis C-methylase UbiE